VYASYKNCPLAYYRVQCVKTCSYNTGPRTAWWQAAKKDFVTITKVSKRGRNNRIRNRKVSHVNWASVKWLTSVLSCRNFSVRCTISASFCLSRAESLSNHCWFSAYHFSFFWRPSISFRCSSPTDWIHTIWRQTLHRRHTAVKCSVQTCCPRVEMSTRRRRSTVDISSEGWKLAHSD